LFKVRQVSRDHRPLAGGQVAASIFKVHFCTFDFDVAWMLTRAAKGKNLEAIKPLSP
jgi:hypothetical protein